MAKEIEYIGEIAIISDYEPKNHFDNQSEWVTENIPLNPLLRDDFDETPNDERDPLENEHWWCKPYIVTQFSSLTDRNYSAFFQRLNSYCHKDIISEEEWKKDFSGLHMENDAYTHGVSFIVRCLDGGAWDRSSWKGQFNNLADAILCAESL